MHQGRAHDATAGAVAVCSSFILAPQRSYGFYKALEHSGFGLAMLHDLRRVCSTGGRRTAGFSMREPIHLAAFQSCCLSAVLPFSRAAFHTCAPDMITNVRLFTAAVLHVRVAARPDGCPDSTPRRHRLPAQGESLIISFPSTNEMSCQNWQGGVQAPRHTLTATAAISKLRAFPVQGLYLSVRRPADPAISKPRLAVGFAQYCFFRFDFFNPRFVCRNKCI